MGVRGSTLPLLPVVAELPVLVLMVTLGSRAWCCAFLTRCSWPLQHDQFCLLFLLKEIPQSPHKNGEKLGHHVKNQLEPPSFLIRLGSGLYL